MPQQPHEVPALRVSQWLRAWDNVSFDAKGHRSKPEPHFYVTKVEAGLLKRLANVRRREVGDGERIDSNAIQRRHDQDRSDGIADYVRVGYPWADVSSRRQKSDEYRNLRKPGWLPTALVVNILGGADRRNGEGVAPADLIKIGPESGGVTTIELPGLSVNKAWRPSRLAPIEVIDGQHRLWAFTEQGLPESFELPVVAFHALDISWQAYLFYTINIKPKKINRSLAFDLYPLLRTEDWLESAEGAAIYRETRAQELTEILWSHPSSPWRARINMLGEPGSPGVSQAAWIRSLMASFVKGWDGRGQRVGGLYGAPVGGDRLALPWARAQQAAFVIVSWRALRDEIVATNPSWVLELGSKPDQAMWAPFSLINTDQGIRALLQIFNDLTYLQARELALFSWTGKPAISEAVDLGEVTEAIASANEQPFGSFLHRVSRELATFDWRTAAAPGLSEDLILQRQALRGSGGYGELRRQLIRHLTAGDDELLSELATRLSSVIGK